MLLSKWDFSGMKQLNGVWEIRNREEGGREGRKGGLGFVVLVYISEIKYVICKLQYVFLCNILLHFADKC